MRGVLEEQLDLERQKTAHWQDRYAKEMPQLEAELSEREAEVSKLREMQALLVCPAAAPCVVCVLRVRG